MDQNQPGPVLKQIPPFVEQRRGRMHTMKEELESHYEYIANSTDDSTEVRRRSKRCRDLLKELGSLKFTLGDRGWKNSWISSEIGPVISKFAKANTAEHPAFAVPRGLAEVIVMMIKAAAGCQGRALDALRIYRERKEEIERQAKRKPDMRAYKELREKYSWLCEREHGSLSKRGIPVGLLVDGRGEAAFLGIHCNILSGIDAIKDYPCYAVCIAGKYEDIEKDGTIIYTGAGGQNKGRQVEDQKDGVSNGSLIRSQQTQTPIRVLRKIGDKNGCTYRYEGLYRCVRWTYEASNQGPKVYKFKLKPMEKSTRYFTKFASNRQRKG